MTIVSTSEQSSWSFTLCNSRFGLSSGIMSYTITNLFPFPAYLPFSSNYLGWRLAVNRHDMIPAF